MPEQLKLLEACDIWETEMWGIFILYISYVIGTQLTQIQAGSESPHQDLWIFSVSISLSTYPQNSALVKQNCQKKYSAA